MGDPKAPLMLDMTLTKGSVHIAVQRGFVDFVLHNPVAARFQQWVNDTWIPDETFFSSLNHSPQQKVPGSYLGKSYSPEQIFLLNTLPFGNSDNALTDGIPNRLASFNAIRTVPNLHIRCLRE